MSFLTISNENILQIIAYSVFFTFQILIEQTGNKKLHVSIKHVHNSFGSLK